MSQVTQRCLLASAAFHAALLSVLVFAPAFTPERPPLPVLTLIPTDLKLTDGDQIGGGNPDAQPPAAAAKPRPEPPKLADPQPEPIRPPPKPTEPEKEPDPKSSAKLAKPVHVAEDARRWGGRQAARWPAAPRPCAQPQTTRRPACAG